MICRDVSDVVCVRNFLFTTYSEFVQNFLIVKLHTAKPSSLIVNTWACSNHRTFFTFSYNYIHNYY